jgi:hypothetical protein
MAISRIKVYNKTITSANDEVSQVLDSFCHKVEIKCRTFADIKLAYAAGESGTTYTTIPAGSMKTITGANGQPIASLTLYMQSPSAGVVAEIEVYL